MKPVLSEAASRSARPGPDPDGPLPAPQTWLAIVNPTAGNHKSRDWHKPLATRLEHDLGAQVVFTQRPGHAAEIAAAARQFEALAVVGGDGTTADVVNGMDLGRQAVLVLATGTGNGLARDLGLASFDAAFAAARAGRCRVLDLINVTYRIDGQAEPIQRLAISTAAIGYVAEAVQLANRRFKSLGKLCYPVSAAVQAARQRPFRLSVTIDEAAPSEPVLTNVLVNNTQHAGNFRPFRRADLSDGQIDLLLARAGFLTQLLHNFSVLTRTYVYTTAAEISSRSLTVRPNSPQRLMIDGELWEGVSEARFEVLPSRLRCFAP